MSFILDALKKAESERHQRVAPVLMDARIAPPRRGLPAWVWVLGAVLLANLALLGFMLWRSSDTPAAPAALQPEAGVASTSTATNDAPAPAPQTPSQPQPVIPPAVSPALPAVTPATPVLPGATPRAPATLPSVESLPSLHELRASGVALPDLQLQLHAYDAAPEGRSVLLNGQRLREGEYTPNGVKVERITPTGVVLEAVGRRFRLEAGL